MEKEIDIEKLPNESKVKILTQFVDGAVDDLWGKDEAEFLLIVSRKGKKESLVGGTMPLKKAITIIVYLANKVLMSILPDKEKEKVEDFLNTIYTAMEGKTESETIH